MLIVESTQQYWEFVRALRMDVRVIDGFIETIPTSSEQQIAYMTKNAKFYRICIVEGKPAGYFGVIDDDIRVCTHPDFQGMGVGKFMINECIKIWPNSFAKVKLSNNTSIKLFLSAGFEEFKADENFVFFRNQT
jgi:hypothetical protein